MTDYELAYLIGETAMNVQTMFMNVFSIVSAYLLVAYLLAARLTKTMLIIINTMFVLVMLSMTFTLIRHVAILVDLIEQVHLSAESGGGLAWHASSRTPLWLAQLMPAGMTFFLCVMTAGSLYFFFHTHKAHSQQNPMSSPLLPDDNTS